MSAWIGSKTRAKASPPGSLHWITPKELADALAGGRTTRRAGREWQTWCPAHDDHDPSLNVRADTAELLFRCRAGCSQQAVIEALRSRGLWHEQTHDGAPPKINGNGEHKPADDRADDDWQSMIPPPAEAPAPAPKKLRCDMLHEYRGANDELLFYVRRIESQGSKKKLFLPLTYGTLNGVRGWHDKAPDAPRPLYRLNVLAHADPGAIVTLCEGEKAAEAAQRMFPDHVAMTWCGGTNSDHLADLSALRGRTVILWPDADEPGRAAMERHAKRLRDMGCTVRTIDTADLPKGFDAADLEELDEDPDDWLAARLPPPPSDDAIQCIELPKLASFSEIEPRQWAYGRFLLFGSASVLGAVDGAGKGWITVARMLSIVTGRELLGERVWRKGAVGIITYEDNQKEWLRRIAAACIHYKINYEDVRPYIFFLARPSGARIVLAQRALSGETIFPDSAAIVAQLKSRSAACLVVDPFNSTHQLDDGNNNVQIVRVAMEVSAIGERAGVAAMVLHHLRKGATGEVDDLMGATSLRANFRVCQIMKVMSEQEAKDLGIPDEDRSLYLRISGSKENYAPRAREAKWFKLLSVPLGNGTAQYPEGDNMAVATVWVPPSPFAGVSMEVVRGILDAIRQGAPDGRRYSPHRRSNTWAGSLIAERTGKTEEKAAGMLATWIKNSLLVVGEYQDPSRNMTACVTVNETIAAEMSRPWRPAEDDA